MLYDFCVIVLVPTLLLRLVLLEQLRPLLLVGLAGLLADGQLGEHLDHRHETRQHDKVDEADLALCNVRHGAVVQGVHLELVHFLQVALSEELHEEQVAPQTAQLPLFSRVADVRKMEHELNEKFFVLAINLIKVEVAIDIRDGLHLAQLDEMLRHVRRQHRLNDDVPAALEILAIHVDGPVARLVFGHEREGSGQMVILQHADIVVPHRNLIIHID